MPNNKIVINNASIHNLKNIDVEIPKNKLTVITGPSGSGKSSLAFDTIFAEGQKRYLESLSSSAAKFLDDLESPQVDSITGLSPSIAIDQKTVHNNPRSTVGTITEIYDFFRLLFSKVGTLYCPESNQPILQKNFEEIIQDILKYKTNSKLIFTVRKEATKKEISKYLKIGYIRCLNSSGEEFYLEEILDSTIKFSDKILYLVIDRVILKENSYKRVRDAVDKGLYEGKGTLYLYLDDEFKMLSTKLISSLTGKVFDKPAPRHFSFNSPLGQCPTCRGLGVTSVFQLNRIIDSEATTFLKSIIPIQANKPILQLVENILISNGETKDTPLAEITQNTLNEVFYGTNKISKSEISLAHSEIITHNTFLGIIPWLEKKYNYSTSEKDTYELEKYMDHTVCRDCSGFRLSNFSKNIKLCNFTIFDFLSDDLSVTLDRVNKLTFTNKELLIASNLLKEIESRLQCLIDIGLEYLTLNRSSQTLSGGEMQRIRLASQIGNSLSGVLYVLDEPSIGLHPYDNHRMIHTLKKIKDNNNTLIVVEHDEEMMKNADHIIDMGPGAGLHGGKIICHGTLKSILQNKYSLTANYLNGDKIISIPNYKFDPKEWLCITKAHQHNLKDVNLEIPLTGMTCITGVSGSGKSTLIHQVLVPAMKSKLRPHFTQYKRNNYEKLTGYESIKSLIEIDQSPIGRSPKSNPATYSGIFDKIRTLYAKLPESQIKGYSAGRFSFNVKDGRCSECEGHGTIKFDVSFLPPQQLTCQACKGKRYNQDTLQVKFKGLSIADVLDLTIDQALEIFKYRTSIIRSLQALHDVGLGYLTLGQSSLSLSGGEAQRLKLAKELAKTTKGKCLYILDEPTTGLHFDDINTLLKSLSLLVRNDHPVLIIEHNLDVIMHAHHIIDMGPHGGIHGGEIVAQGPLKNILKSKRSLTGHFLNRLT